MNNESSEYDHDYECSKEITRIVFGFVILAMLVACLGLSLHISY